MPRTPVDNYDVVLSCMVVASRQQAKDNPLSLEYIALLLVDHDEVDQ